MADDIVPEEWRPIEGWPEHEVSNRGRVRRIAITILKPTVAHNGYLRISLYDITSKKMKQRALSNLVCAAFNGPRPSPDHIVAHNDGDKLHNAPDNLRWATQSENMQDKYIHGTHQRGTRNGFNKLTEAQVREIRHLAATTHRGVADIARRYGISKATAHRIWRRKSWEWLPD